MSIHGSKETQNSKAINVKTWSRLRGSKGISPPSNFILTNSSSSTHVLWEWSLHSGRLKMVRCSTEEKSASGFANLAWKDSWWDNRLLSSTSSCSPRNGSYRLKRMFLVLVEGSPEICGCSFGILLNVDKNKDQKHRPLNNLQNLRDPHETF